MMELGDLSALKGLSIDKGSVFKMTLFPSDGVKPKKEEDISRDKYFVVLGKDNNSIIVGAVLINSDINYNLLLRIAPFQISLEPEEYEFLQGKRRFLDCYRIKKIPFERILNDAEFIGAVSDDIIERAIQLVNHSDVNSTKDLKQFGICLRN